MPSKIKKPEDLSKGVEAYFEFHQLNATKIGVFVGLKIPNKLSRAGDSKWIAYRSSKWSGKPANYIHDHSHGAHTYKPGAGNMYDVPYAATRAKTLVRLGHCLGFEYEDSKGPVEAVVRAPYPELYCTPDGSVLLVIEDKRKLLAMIWGGSLDVTKRGIVG